MIVVPRIINIAIADFVPATATTFKVSMSPWTNYTFRVIARNKVELERAVVMMINNEYFSPPGW